MLPGMYFFSWCGSDISITFPLSGLLLCHLAEIEIHAMFKILTMGYMILCAFMNQHTKKFINEGTHCAKTDHFVHLLIMIRDLFTLQRTRVHVWLMHSWRILHEQLFDMKFMKQTWASVINFV